MGNGISDPRRRKNNLGGAIWTKIVVMKLFVVVV
jgi:hypothetical protein